MLKKFANKTAIISGASRGIGREIALKLASEGANIVLAAKTKEPHQTLVGTIMSVAKEIEDIGAKALPYQIDVRGAEGIVELTRAAHEKFGRIDILVNNAGAIYLTDTLSTGAKQFDLMHDVNVRATFLLSQACIPYMKEAGGGHVLNLSPPLNFDLRFLSPHIAYTMSKFGMSMCTLGMAEEFKEDNISFNSLWPKALIYTAAISRLMGEEAMSNCRNAAIMADAAAWIFSQPCGQLSGKLLLDEEVMTKAGVNDLTSYSCVKGAKLLPDLYVS